MLMLTTERQTQARAAAQGAGEDPDAGTQFTCFTATKGTQFTCFTATKVRLKELERIRTQNLSLLALLLQKYKY
jgi:hypothetical protein